MAEEDYDVIPYKDISDLKRELEGMRGKKDISSKELYDAVQRLSKTISDMLEVFSAAAEQMKMEEREYELDTKKHEIIISKLDKLIEQNRTIAEGMVAIVDMIKEKLVMPAKREEEFFKPKEEPRLFKPQQEWQPRPEPSPFKPQWQEPLMPTQPMPPPPTMASLTPPPDFGMQMPPMEPAPPPSLDFPEEPFLEEQPKKKGLFGIFKK